MRSLPLIFLSLLLFTTACSQLLPGDQSTVIKTTNERVNQTEQKVTEPKEKYLTDPSAIDPQFPVPKGAVKSSKQNKNPQILYVRYDYPDLTDVAKRQAYFQQIKSAGWTELPAEQLGSMHVFVKGKKRIQVIIHADFFTLSTSR